MKAEIGGTARRCIPARYLSGYTVGPEPPDFHGDVQVDLGGDWHDVDATSEEARPALVPIAFGRDAADVAIATLWGRNMLIEQSVEVRTGSPQADRPWKPRGTPLLISRSNPPPAP